MSRIKTSPTKYIKANFTECDGVDMLSVFLREGERLFPNFNSNEKRMIFDGDLDYLNDKKEIVKVFRCQIKSLKRVYSSFKIDYKYLVACSNKVSLDPLLFFVVDTSKQEFYYLNLTLYHPNEVQACVKAKKSLTVKIKDFTKLDSPQTLINEIESNYLYTVSLSELTLEELRIIMSGITYMNNAINKVPLIRDALFPNFYSFVVGYEKNTDEGIKVGLFSNKHNVISIMPVSIDSSENLVQKYKDKIEKNKFVSRAFDKTAFEEIVFKDYLTFIFREAFYHSQCLLPIMPDVILFELIYAALYYEFKKLGNKVFGELISSNAIELTRLKDFKISDVNPYQRFFRCAIDECLRRRITTIEKVWKYWDNEPSSIEESTEAKTLFENDIKLFFERYPIYSNLVIRSLIDDDYSSNYSYFYYINKNENTNTANVLFLSKNVFEYQNDRHSEKANSNGHKVGANFENMNCFAPLFSTIVNKCYKVLCERFDCKYNQFSIEGNEVFII